MIAMMLLVPDELQRRVALDNNKWRHRNGRLRHGRCAETECDGNTG